MKKLLMLLIALMIIPSALAAVNVTYTFNVNDVSSQAFDCLDASCSQVRFFAGEYQYPPGGPSNARTTTDGTLAILYPDSIPQGTHHYREFFVSDGYVPLVGYGTLHTGGQPGIATTSEHNNFEKLPGTCRAPISALQHTNQVTQGQPITVQSSTQLSAQMDSVFSQLTSGFVSPGYEQEHFAADVDVTLDILNDQQQVMHTQVAQFNAQNRNAIFAGASAPIQFDYLTSTPGNFTARLTSTVTDNQCAAQQDTVLTSQFTVVPQVTESFFNQLNSLQTNATNPSVGETINVSFDKITNHIDNLGVATPVQSQFDFSVVNTDTGLTVLNLLNVDTFTNAGPVTPEQYSFLFTPTQAGLHNITVTLRANHALSGQIPETVAEQAMTTFVQTGITPTYTITFNIVNASSGLGIENAEVNMLNVGTNLTNTNGQASIYNVPAGTQSYNVTATNFTSISNVISVVGSTTITHAMQETNFNTPPTVNLPNITLPENGMAQVFLDNFVTDAEDPNSALIWQTLFFNNLILINTDINPNRVLTLTDNGFNPVGSTGILHLRVTDTQGNFTNAELNIEIVPPQTLSFLQTPQFVFTEDRPQIRLVDLYSYINGTQFPNQLIYSVVNVNDTSLLSASIDSNQYVTIIPEPDQSGRNATITVRAENQQGFAETDILVTVLPENDAPRVISVPTIPILEEDTPHMVNLSLVFFDVDGDPLNYTNSSNPNLSFFINDTANNFTVVSALNFVGTTTFNITARDPLGASETATFSITYTPKNDPPFISPVIPGIDTPEEQSGSLDLTVFENDPEEGSGNSGVNVQNLTWKMRLAGTSDTPVNVLDHALFNATLNISNDFLEVNPKLDQVGIANIELFLFDPQGLNDSQTIYVNISNVNDAPVFVNLSNQTTEFGFPFIYDANATDVDPTNDIITFNDFALVYDINSSTGIINFTPTAQSLLGITLSEELQVCDNHGACTNSTFNITIVDTTAPSFGTLVHPVNHTYNATAIDRWTGLVTDNGFIDQVTLEIDGVNNTVLPIGGSNVYDFQITGFDAGTHTFRWFANDTMNNVASTSFESFTIYKENTSLDLALNGSRSNIVVNQSDLVEINATLLANGLPVTANENISLFIDRVLLQNNFTPTVSVNRTFPDSGVFNISANFSGDNNYNGDFTSLLVNVVDSVPPDFRGGQITPSTLIFNNPINFTHNITDNVDVDTATLEIDSLQNFTATRVGNIFNVTLSSISAGTHNYTWYANDTSNNLNSTVSAQFTVQQAQPTLDLTLNGVADNLTIDFLLNVTSVANLTDPTGQPLTLFINQSLAQTGASPLINISNFRGTHNPGDLVNVTAVFAGNQNYTATSKTLFVNLTSGTPPIFTQEVVNPVSPTVTGLTYSFRINITDAGIGQIVAANLEFNNSNVTATPIGGDIYEVNLTGIGNGTHQYRWFALDNSRNIANTSLQNYVIDNQASFINLSVNGQTTSTVSVEQNAPNTIIANLTRPTSGPLTLLFNGTPVQSGASPLINNSRFLVIGPVNVTATFPGDANFSSNSSTIIVDVTPAIPPTFTQATVNPASPTVVGLVYNFRVNVTDNGVVDTVNLEFNNTNNTATLISGNIYEVNLSNAPANTYQYRWFANDTIGNIANTSLENYTINRRVPNVTLSLNNVQDNITVEQNSLVTAIGNITDPATGGFLNLSINGTSVSTGASPLTFSRRETSVGQFNYSLEFPGDNNYTAFRVSYNVTVTPAQVPQFSNELLIPAHPAPFSPVHQFRIDVIDNGQVDNVTLEFNGTNSTSFLVSGNTYETNLTNIPVGSYQYRWFANDTVGNLNNTPFATYNVTKGTPLIDLTLNGVRDNIIAQVNDNVDIFANLTFPAAGNINLTVNGTQVYFGVTPRTVTQSFPLSGTYVVNATFNGSSNFNSGVVSRTITVQPPITITSITPGNNARTNFSHINVTVETSAPTTCAWDKRDVAQGAMTNSFTSVGSTHTATITLADSFALTQLTNHDISIACNGQNSQTNTDLVYTVDNILDGSTITGVNNFFNLVLINSTFDNSTFVASEVFNSNLTRIIGGVSQINDSDLTDCSIQMSIVKGIRASGCNFLPGSFIDPPQQLDLTGTTTQASTVLESTLTFSLVNNSFVQNSLINNTNINNSNVNESEFDDALVNDANISFNVIYTGTIERAGVVYDATANGPANLSDVVQLDPIADFTPKTTTVNLGSAVSFVSNSTDRNIGGLLQDNLTYFWTFGDGTNSTNQNPSKTYAALGTYNVTLSVTDGFGLQDSESGQVTVQQAPSSPRRTGGGGGGGGGAPPMISITDAPTTQLIHVGRPLTFRVDGSRMPMSLVLRSVDSEKQESYWMFNGREHTVTVGEHAQFDLDRNGQADLDILPLDVARASSRVTFVKATLPEPAPFNPDNTLFANFGDKKDKQEEVEESPVEDIEEIVEEVEVVAEIEGPSPLSKALSKLKEALTFNVSADSIAIKLSLVLAVIILGLIAYALFVRWEDSF